MGGGDSRGGGPERLSLDLSRPWDCGRYIGVVPERIG